MLLVYLHNEIILITICTSMYLPS